MKQKNKDDPNKIRNITKQELNNIIPLLHQSSPATLVILDDSYIKDEEEGRRIINRLFFYSDEMWDKLIILSSCKDFIRLLIEEKKERLYFHNKFLVDDQIPNKQLQSKPINVYVLPSFGRRSICSIVKNRFSNWLYAGLGGLFFFILSLALNYVLELYGFVEKLGELPFFILKIVPYLLGVSCVIGVIILFLKVFYKLDRECMRELGENKRLKIVLTEKMNHRKAKLFWRRWVCRNKMGEENNAVCISNHTTESNELAYFPEIIFDTKGNTKDGIRYLLALVEYWETKDMWKKLF